MSDTPLDMRASKKDKIMASDILNGYTKHKLTKIFENFGEIGNARRLSEAIIQSRKKKRITTTKQLVDIIKREYKISEKNIIKFSSKIFQALRVSINKELENLENALSQSLDLLDEGGRLVVVSYHSLEDRIVKNFFRENSFVPSRSKYKSNEKIAKPKIKVLTKKPVSPEVDEIMRNPRARSAKLRAAERI
jgi:16S rRNA (cytosine1402-N4)-methyltransferase